MKGLFHVHSNYSSDGCLSLEDLRNESALRGFQFVVVTDHAEDFEPGKLEKFVAHCREVSDESFWIIPGLEFVIDRAHQVHLLVVGIDGCALKNGAGKILERIQQDENNIFAVIAHLSRSNHHVPPNYAKTIHGIEIWNAAYDSRYLPDHKAIRLFWKIKKNNARLVGFGGLDLHDYSGFRGLSLHVKDSCRNPNELILRLKEGQFEIHGPHMTLSSDPRIGLLRMLILGLGRAFLVAVDNLYWKIKTHPTKADKRPDWLPLEKRHCKTSPHPRR